MCFHSIDIDCLLLYKKSGIVTLRYQVKNNRFKQLNVKHLTIGLTRPHLLILIKQRNPKLYHYYFHYVVVSDYLCGCVRCVRW